ncbi:MAG: hypothetical protein JSV80_07840 [Acidobacteriota bacterium]|nr:MAG: hypothetical protein JSV80_07840 [Acidobacteriota bacterium]
MSHDVDHLSLREHLVDAFLPRYVLALLRQNLTRGRFRLGRVLDSFWGLLLAACGRDRWDVVDDLLAAERRAGVSSTWFVAVRRGLGISYRGAARERLVGRLRDADQEIGLHGQSPTDASALAAEAEQLSREAGTPIVGLRMHYLRLTRSVFDGMERAGMRYDSTVMNRSRLEPDQIELPGPRLVRPGLLEIPLHVMDSTLFSVTGLGLDFDQARDYMRRLAARAADEGKLVTINLHPNTYSHQTPEMRAWYDALLADVTARSDVFVSDFRALLPRIAIA